jgi:diamine N-acetyltransferase
VTRDTWQESLRLAVLPEQQRFVADYAPIAAIGLAKAYVRPGGLLWLPYAFHVDSVMVGFADVACEPDRSPSCWIFHFFIDSRYQRQGYGTQALRQLVEVIGARFPECRSVHVTVHPENEQAKRLYTAAGFEPSGREIDGEPIYDLQLPSAALRGGSPP